MFEPFSIPKKHHVNVQHQVDGAEGVDDGVADEVIVDEEARANNFASSASIPNSGLSGKNGQPGLRATLALGTAVTDVLADGVAADGVADDGFADDGFADDGVAVEEGVAVEDVADEEIGRGGFTGSSKLNGLENPK